MPTADNSGTLIYAHGGGERWKQGVFELAEALREITTGKTAVAFELWPEEHTLQAAFDQFSDARIKRVTALPLMVSQCSGVYRGFRDRLDEVSEFEFELAPVLLQSGVLMGLYETRYLEHSAEAERGVLLVAHGPRTDADALGWMRELRELSGELENRTGAVHCSAGLARDDAEVGVKREAEAGLRELCELLGKAAGTPPLVIPVAVSDGSFNRETVPALFDGLEAEFDTRPVLDQPSQVAELLVERGVLDAQSEATS